MNRKIIVFLFLAAILLLPSCDNGALGDADVTTTFLAREMLFENCLEFFEGDWDSGYGDGYFIRKWGNISAGDKARIQTNFPLVDPDNLKTYDSGKKPVDEDYIIMYPVDVSIRGGNGVDTFGGTTTFLGLVRAINIFNGDPDRGAIIIEYFEDADPWYLSHETNHTSIRPQGLTQGEKPYFGIYYRVLDSDNIQFANATDLAVLYSSADKPYHVERKTFEEALEFNSIENEAELISWGIVMPAKRQ